MSAVAEDAEIATAQIEFQRLTAQATALKAAIGSLERSSTELSFGSSQRLRPEFEERVVTAVNALRKAKADASELEKQKNVLSDKLRAATLDVETAKAATEVVATATHTDEIDARHFVMPRDVVSIIDERCRALEVARGEHATLRSQAEDLSAVVRRLGAEVDDLSDLDWELFRMRAEVGIKESQLASVRDEMASIRRILLRKERLLSQFQGFDNASEVKSLASCREIEHRRLLLHKDASRRSDAATRSGAITIRLREEKLHLLGQATYDVLQTILTSSADQLVDPMDECDAADVDDIRAEVAKSREQEEQLQLGVDFFDQQIRNLEARVEILTKATAVRKREIEADEKKKASAIRHIDAAALAQSNVAAALLERRKDSVQLLKGRLRR